MSEELLPIFVGILISFIGILIAFILGIFGIYTKLLEIIKPLIRIETHASRIPSVEDKIGELASLIERTRLGSSVKRRLKKSNVLLVIGMKNRTANRTVFEIRSETPFIPAVFQRAVQSSVTRIPIRASNQVGRFILELALEEADPKKCAKHVGLFLYFLDEEWYKEKHWEEIFGTELTK